MRCRPNLRAISASTRTARPPTTLRQDAPRACSRPRSKCVLMLALTFGGGLQWLHELTAGWFAPGVLRGIALCWCCSRAITTVLDLPFALVPHVRHRAALRLQQDDAAHVHRRCCSRTRRSPRRSAFRCSRASCGSWSARASLWWLYAWLIWIAFNLRDPDGLSDLDRAALQQVRAARGRAAEDSASSACSQRCGFKAQGLMVMDGSRRSSHGNAYFTGFGKIQAHRILRHAAGAARTERNRGGARARAGPLQAAPRHQAHRLAVRRPASLFLWLLGSS